MISIFRDPQTSDLNAHFKKCNQTLDELPGTDLTHAQQQALLRQYQDQLKRKRCRVCACVCVVKHACSLVEQKPLC
jgi:hypothetical protein